MECLLIHLQNIKYIFIILLKSKTIFSFFIIFSFTSLIAQNRKQLLGKIVVINATPANVLILNLNTNQEVKSDSQGKFSILATVNDVLAFSSENLDFTRKIIEQTEFEQQNFVVNMFSKRIVLDEVEIINHQSINAVSLGILSKPAKSYTPQERRLQTAGDFKPIHLLSILGGSMPLDPVMNAINGKTKRLKKEIKLEQNQKRMTEFFDFYSKEKLIENIKIHPNVVYEFVYYIIEDPLFIEHLALKNKDKMTFYLIEKHSIFKNRASTDE